MKEASGDRGRGPAGIAQEPGVYRYTGQQWDAPTGGYYLRARYMDPKAGRFLEVDPFGGWIRNPITLHRYVYAGVSPINSSDPSGEDFSLSSTLTTVANIGSLAARVTGTVMRGLRITRAARFFWDARRFSTVSRGYWASRGAAAGRSLHHWLIPQRWSWVPEGLRNAGFNLLELPAISVGSLTLNSWMGFAVRWGGYRMILALTVENGIRLLIPVSVISTGAAGVAASYEVGSALTEEDMEREADDPENILGPMPDETDEPE